MGSSIGHNDIELCVFFLIGSTLKIDLFILFSIKLSDLFGLKERGILQTNCTNGVMHTTRYIISGGSESPILGKST